MKVHLLWAKHPAAGTANPAAGLATWAALLSVMGFILAWTVVNSHLAGKGHHFDPYPWILLNLCLSCFAALQCFVLLIANKRGEQIAAEIALHTEQNTEDLKNVVDVIKANTDLLQDIHQHVESLALTAPKMPPGR